MTPDPQTASALKVLVVDDEALLVRTCARLLEQEGYAVLTATRGQEGLELVRRQRPEIMLTDLNLPDMDGLALLREARAVDPDLLVIMITAFATVDSSIEAIRAGAYDYIPKPFTATQLQVLMGRAANRVQLARDNRRLRGQLQERYSLENVVGGSEAMQQVASVVSRVAPTDASVLISGESGTGKELIARATHVRSRRSERPFVAVNCAAFPENLLESELFGHERGAFTGAESQKRGLLEHASGGTFFLDEISEMPLGLQTKLLRVLQERSIRRVGGTAEIPIDIRVIAATNRDPSEAVRAGVLRQDLFFRLNVVPVRIPPLRGRREDIPLLAQHFLRRYAQEYERDGAAPLRLSGEAMRALVAFDWPGNVRQLQNVMERVVSLALPGEELGVEDLPEEIQRGRGAGQPLPVRMDGPFHDAKSEAIDAFERAYLRELLERHHGNISRAAREAGIDRKTIHRLLKKHALSPRALRNE